MLCNNLLSLCLGKSRFTSSSWIFYSNCFKNGILPIILDDVKIKELSEYANRKEEISIDLNEEKIVYGNSKINFKIDSFKKKCLLEGLDDIALSLKKANKIEIFENELKRKKPGILNDESKKKKNFMIAWWWNWTWSYCWSKKNN